MQLVGMLGWSRFQLRTGGEGNGQTRRCSCETIKRQQQFRVLLNILRMIGAARDRSSTSENRWLVDFDSTVVPETLDERVMDPEYDQLRGIQWKGVEIISKILTAGEEAFQEVGKMANILSKTFRTEVNRSCGLHIHVGNGDAGFDLETLESLAEAWVFDRKIIVLHPR